MTWPFTSAPAPAFDSGFVSIPTNLTAVPTVGATDQIYLMGMRFTNPTAGSIDIEVQDGSGAVVYQQTVPPGAPDPHETPFEPITGLQWIASDVGLIGHLWGY